jgi:penicillin amidase
VTAFLGEEKKFTVADMSLLQNNVTSVVAAELAHKLMGIVSQETQTRSEQSGKAVAILKSWNGSMQIEDVAPVIYYRFQYELLKNIMMDELGAKDFLQFQQTHVQKNSVTPLLLNDTSVWVDNRNTSSTETYRKIVDLSFDSTMIFLQEQLGADVEQWNWGRVHLLEHVHPIGRQQPFDKFFNVGPFPAPGGSETVNNAGFDFSADGYYKVKFGPALRRTLDFADPLHGQSVLPTGQSGNFMSDHYKDQAKMFVRCEKRVEMMDRDEIVRGAKNYLVLLPVN